ncbi:MAG: tetratricopeptide repeat protein [Desulfobacterales bacterium]|nr:tetratricopeptide repeat protein [Desulfobacterales bacterium]
MDKANCLPDKSGNAFLKIVLPLLLLALLTGAIYSNTLDAPFVFDAGGYIQNDSAIRMTELSWEQISTAAFESVPKKRFLANLSFAFNYYFGKYEVLGYHLVNILIHLCCGIFLFLFVKTTLSRTPAGRAALPPGLSAPAVAFLTAALWLAFPINTGAVTYIVQRMTSLAVMFFILSMLLYVLARLSFQANRFSGRTITLFTGCLIAGLCAFATKQNTATLPILILLYEFFFFQDLKLRLSRRKALWLAGGLILFAGVALFYLGENPLDRILSAYNRREFTLPERVMTEWRIIVYYISLFFWPVPWRLNLDYDYPLSYHLANPLVTSLSLFAIISLIILAVFISRRHRIIAFCMLWFFINLAIESSVIGIELIYEHRTYLPFMMLSLAAVVIAGKISRRPKIPAAVLGIVILVFSVWTYQRNTIWQEPIAFWVDGIKKSPRDGRLYANTGHEYLQQDKYKQAIPYYQSALSLWTKNQERRYGPKTHFHLGAAYTKTGQPEKAESHYRKAIALGPKHAKAHFNLAQLLTEKGNMESAAHHYKKVIEIEPDYTDAHVNLGNIYARESDYNKAKDHFHRALKYEPQKKRPTSTWPWRILCSRTMKRQRRSLNKCWHTIQTILLYTIISPACMPARTSRT